MGEQVDAFGLASAGIHVGVGEAGHQRHVLFGAGDGDIEPAFAALLEQGAEPVEEAAVWSLAVADRQDDRVAFVALDAL